MNVSEEIKAVNNKIEKNKAQFDLDRQTAKISALSSRNIGEYKFLTGKDVLPENNVLGKAATIKKLEYIEKQNWIIVLIHCQAFKIILSTPFKKTWTIID